MYQRRHTTTIEQLTALVDFMEQHRDLALGRVRSKEARAVAARLWRECSLILNAEGPARTGKEWAKVWNDLKCRVRAKLVSINASHQATGGGPSSSTSLTALEDKIANILGRDVGPLPNVRQDPFAVENDTINEVNPEPGTIEEFIAGDQLEPLDSGIQLEPSMQESGVIDTLQQDADAVQDAAAPIPSPRDQIPPTPGPSALRRQRQRNLRAARRLDDVPVPPAQSNRTALDESRLMMMEIEKMRAEPALKVAEGFLLLAQSCDRFTRQYAARQEEGYDY